MVNAGFSRRQIHIRSAGPVDTGQVVLRPDKRDYFVAADAVKHGRNAAVDERVVAARLHLTPVLRRALVVDGKDLLRSLGHTVPKARRQEPSARYRKSWHVERQRRNAHHVGRFDQHS